MEVGGGAEGDEAVGVGEGREDADFVGVFELQRRRVSRSAAEGKGW